ncbi:hypothetical protein L0337_18530 [candidate division KSB1 bacterium]|nr:hypothetical protein [candidate division KSB1 bacterium]
MNDLRMPIIYPSQERIAEEEKRKEAMGIRIHRQTYKDADVFCKVIKQHIEETTASLKKDENLIIAMTLKNGQTINPDDFECIDKNFFLLHGVDQNKNRITVLTHKKDIQLLFTVEKKPVEQPRK